MESVEWKHQPNRLPPQDYIGIRPVILLGTFCNGTLTVMFGFSKSLEYAMTIRLVTGLLNGNIGVVKTFIGLISDETNEAVAFGSMALCWGFGRCACPCSWRLANVL